jgi:hypothetical protein
MAEMLMPSSGAKGLDISTANGGKVSLNPDKKGRITVTDPKLERVLRDEGFSVSAQAAGFAVEGFPCACGFQSVFRVCGKCGTDNGSSDE